MSCPDGCGGDPIDQGVEFSTTIECSEPDTIVITCGGGAVNAIVDDLGGGKFKITVSGGLIEAPGPLKIEADGSCVECHEVTAS